MGDRMEPPFIAIWKGKLTQTDPEGMKTITMVINHLRNEKKPGCWVIEGIILPSCIGIIISHYKDSRIPINQPVFHGK